MARNPTIATSTTNRLIETFLHGNVSAEAYGNGGSGLNCPLLALLDGKARASQLTVAFCLPDQRPACYRMCLHPEK
jgi:hypothetical protein